MKIHVDSSLLKSAISTAVEALSSRPAKNEWNCVHLQTSDENGFESLKIACQDFGIRISASIPCGIESPGAALIPAKLLQQYVALLSGRMVLTADPNTYRAELKASGKKSLISGFDPGCFIPSTRVDKVEGHASVSGDAFSEMVNGASFCCSIDRTQMVLTGVHFLFSPESKSVECAAIDGYRLALKKASADADSAGEINIPAPIAQKVVSIMGKEKEIRIRFGGGVCVAETDRAEVTFALLSGAYIDYKRLIFPATETRAKVPVSALLSAVKFANIAAMSGKSHAVMVYFDSDFITISAAASDNDSVTRIDCEYVGAPMKVCFNGSYLQAALEKVDRLCDEATLYIKSPVALMAVVPIGDHDSDTYYLVLPARTRG